MSPQKKISSFEFFLSKKVGKAITDYHMLDANDRILVGVSGGKDSLSLLDILSKRKRFVPVKHDLVAVLIDDGFVTRHLPKLKKYLKANNYEYYIERSDIKEKKKDFDCFWCSWNRRKALFKAAEKHNCNKIALGHNKDDVAQTFLMNIFFSSEISTMSPNQEMFKGKMHIIRPLAYVDDKDMARYAKLNKLPVCLIKCPNKTKNNRQLMKKIIKSVERVFPDAKTNIVKSARRIREEYL